MHARGTPAPATVSVLRPPPLKPPAVADGGEAPFGPTPPTRTVSDAPGVTDTVAVVRPPRPPAPPRFPNPRPPCAPVATILMLTTPAGTVKVSGPPV